MTTADHVDRLLENGSAAGVHRAPDMLSRTWSGILLAGDAAIVFFVGLVTLNGAPGNRVVAALAGAILLCGVFWCCGYYKRSFAVRPFDETYYACAGVLLAALPVFLVLALVGAVPTLSVAVMLIFSAVGASAMRVRAHLERRGPAPLHAGVTAVTSAAWHRRQAPGFAFAKRGLDLAVAVAALVLFSPVMLAAALAIALESKGPVLFRQERVGENGHPFRIFKFRTMRTGADTAWARPGDDRITRVGSVLRRTSIDELPQLFNVLRGEMSIVGPRPEMVSYAKDFARSERRYPQRHIVPPGITGWAQVYLARNLQPSDMPAVLPYDLFYVEHASPVIDLAVILKTAAEVIFHRAV